MQRPRVALWKLWRWCLRAASEGPPVGSFASLLTAVKLGLSPVRCAPLPRLLLSQSPLSCCQRLPSAPCSMPSGALSCSSSLSPCLPADALPLLNPLAGLIQRPFRADGRRGERSGDRSSLSLRRRLQLAACDGVGPGALERERVRLGRRAREGPRSPARCASDGPEKLGRGRSAGRS